MLTHLPGEIPIVNRSGETIPAGGIARIVGRDGVDAAFWEVAKPNGADLTRICVVPMDLADDKKGVGLTLVGHPRQVKHSLAGPPAAGSWLGTANGAWLAAAGSSLEVWAGDSTWATVMLHKAAGGAPFSRTWYINDVSPDPVDWVDLLLYYGRGDTMFAVAGSQGIKTDRAGKVSALTVSWATAILHEAGAMDFRVKNKTTGSVAGSPTITGLAEKTEGEGDGTGPSFSKGDILIVQARAATALKDCNFYAPASIVIGPA